MIIGRDFLKNKPGVEVVGWETNNCGIHEVAGRVQGRLNN